MVDLTACYFCGTVEQLGEYPVIPQELYPPESLQQTVVVCPTCRGKLAQALQPIVSYLERPDDESSSPSDSSFSLDSPVAESQAPVEGQIHDSADPDPATNNEEGEVPLADAPRSELPEGAKSMARLLQNRAFPVERIDLVDLAASAYDLEEETCHDILDAFVDRGYLVEADGELRRPSPATPVDEGGDETHSDQPSNETPD